MQANKILMKAVYASLAWSLLASNAHAYRPFDGTDAGVAEPGIFELEIGASRFRQGEQRTLGVPAFTLNFGLEGDTEIVLDARYERQNDGEGSGWQNSLTDTALSIKHVWKAGSLQDKEGISIATECGLLLPTWRGESGTGASCAGIVSQKWSIAAMHLNLGFTHARDRENIRFASLIVEGPEKWTVRPVMELTTARGSTVTQSKGGLAGAIWKVGENLSLDAAMRKQWEHDEIGRELRLGATWNTHF
jgi:hypothetical protein